MNINIYGFKYGTVEDGELRFHITMIFPHVNHLPRLQQIQSIVQHNLPNTYYFIYTDKHSASSVSDPDNKIWKSYNSATLQEIIKTLTL